uniref:DUF4371 domain-containing protein n=1 Tax=Octopus bimaculoides TaxID=37653 RepID=A0A0L8GPF7_OCTBM
MAYLTRKRGQTLTTKLDEQIKAEHDFWKRVLQQVMTVIYLLRERGLAFRNDETFCCPNNGNFLGLLELIAKFDPFLRTHINQYENEGHTSYLSKTICEEVIQLMAKIVLEEIVKEIKEAGYFSVSVDSTLDVSNVDQLTVIVRHVSSLDGIPVERFLTFIELKNHTGEEMVELIPNFFEELEIDFRNCRGQSYNNAANMAGNIYKTVGSAEKTSFHQCQKLRNSYLTQDRKPMPRATTAISASYAHIVGALSHVHDDDTEMVDTRRQAQNILQKNGRI